MVKSVPDRGKRQLLKLRWGTTRSSMKGRAESRGGESWEAGESHDPAQRVRSP